MGAICQSKMDGIMNVSDDIETRFRNDMINVMVFQSPRFWMCILFDIFATSGNLAALCIIISSKHLHTSTFTALASLCLVDILCVNFIFARASNIHHYFIENGYMDEDYWTHIIALLDLIKYVLVLSSTIHILLATIMTYFAVVHPTRSRETFTNRIIAKLCLCAWMLSALVVFFPILAAKFDVSQKSPVRSFSFRATYIFLLAGPLMIFTIFQLFKSHDICEILRGKTKKHRHLVDLRQTFVLVTILNLLHVICIIPFILDVITGSLPGVSSRGAYFASMFCLGLNSCMKPCIYPIISNAYAKGICPCVKGRDKEVYNMDTNPEMTTSTTVVLLDVRTGTIHHSTSEQFTDSVDRTFVKSEATFDTL